MLRCSPCPGGDWPAAYATRKQRSGHGWVSGADQQSGNPGRGPVTSQRLTKLFGHRQVRLAGETAVGGGCESLESPGSPSPCLLVLRAGHHRHHHRLSMRSSCSHPHTYTNQPTHRDPAEGSSLPTMPRVRAWNTWPSASTLAWQGSLLGRQRRLGAVFQNPRGNKSKKQHSNISARFRQQHGQGHLL
jgi:hypothetical protein